MPHGLTIDELLVAARKHVVDACRAITEARPRNRPALTKVWRRALAYRAGVEAAAECIEARVFDIPPANHGDEVTDDHLKRIADLVDQDQFEDAETISGPAW